MPKKIIKDFGINPPLVFDYSSTLIINRNTITMDN
jgi:hypothetical protein